MRTDSPALEVPHLAKPGARGGEGAPGKPLTEAGEIAARAGGKQSSHLRWVASLPGGASGQEPDCQSGDVRDMGWIPGWGSSPGEEHSNHHKNSCLENPMEGGGYSPQDSRESDPTEATSQACISIESSPEQ